MKENLIMFDQLECHCVSLGTIRVEVKKTYIQVCPHGEFKGVREESKICVGGL